MADIFLYKNLIEFFFINNELIGQREQRIEKCFQFVAGKLPSLSVRAKETILKSIKSVEITFFKRWRESKYVDLQRFQRDNEKWVHTSLKLPSSVTSGSQRSVQEKKNFRQLSDRQKNRRVEDLIENDIEMLLLASAKAAKNANEQDLERVIRLLSKDHRVATKILTLLKDEKSFRNTEKIIPLRGLTYFLDSNLSKAQYVNTRLLSKEQGANIFPSYHKILAAKKECRPLPTYMMVNDVSATLPLQELLNHTANRLLSLQEEIIQTQKDKNELKLKLQVKWGVDGSSGQSQYNQKYLTEDPEEKDGNLFATTMVPLRITTEGDPNKIIWNNSTPQSPRWCRPIRLHFAKETAEFTMNEIQSVKREIENLSPLVTTMSGVTITVSYELYLTMIDGKVLAVVTKTKSTQTCCICKATPKQINNLDKINIRFKPEKDSLNYGMSVLHLWIRSFEWLLHISYRKDNGDKWQLRGDDLKKKAQDRKELLQKRFWNSKLKIRVDYPTPGGSGNTNNGNVCRKAFSDPDLLSEILELDKELINRIRIILIALSCQLPLDAERFSKYCIETAHHYVKDYKWFPLPPTVHKALIHSRDILLANDLPVGVLAEDAAESCHKLYRNNRQFHARKNSRRNNLMDVFNRALDSSDPIIVSFGLQKRQNYRKRMKLPDEVLCLLRPPDTPATTEQEFEEDEDDLTPAGSNVLDAILEEFAPDFDVLDLPDDPFYIDPDEETEEEDEKN